jgi:hypothetical protein
MIKFSKIIRFWGLCDLGSVSWYLIWNIFHARMPFYNDLIEAIKAGSLSDSKQALYLMVAISMLFIIFYLSMLFSGFYLLKQNKIGAILSYIQTPFRLLTIIPPSIFFIMWPLKYIFKNPQSITAIITFGVLLFLSEILRLTSVIIWHKNLKKA